MNLTCLTSNVILSRPNEFVILFEAKFISVQSSVVVYCVSQSRGNQTSVLKPMRSVFAPKYQFYWSLIGVCRKLPRFIFRS